MHYNPFGEKDVSDLTHSDLDNLKSVQEGWYVEYKSEVSNPQIIAKSVSSFANTYGGWLFYGIEEKDSTNNIAGSYPGIRKDQLDGSLKSITDSIKSHLNPVPFYEIKSIEIDKDRDIICLYIPYSFQTPHIHSNGRIYRRVGDKSNPIHEDNRQQLGFLWDRKEEINNEILNWIGREPKKTIIESNQPYLRLLLDADLYKNKGKTWDLSPDDVLAVMNNKNNFIRINIDSCYPFESGLIARQTAKVAEQFDNGFITNYTKKSNRHSDFGFTWFIEKDLRSEVWIPLIKYETSDELASFFNNTDENNTTFLDLIEASKYERGVTSIIDLNEVLHLVCAVTASFIDLLEKNNTPVNNFHGKIIISKVWRTVPFVNHKIILDQMKQSGLPICLFDDAIQPSGIDTESFIKLEIEDGKESFQKTLQINLEIMKLVLNSFGIQSPPFDKNDVNTRDESIKFIDELIKAGSYQK